MSPDPASRQPFTTAAFLPLYTCHYVLAVLTILPHTFVLRLALLPIVLLQVWNCAVGLDFSVGVANWLGLESSARLRHLNFMFVVGMFDMALRSVAWTFASLRKPLRRYDLSPDGALVERPLSISGVLLDGFDLIHNFRGIGWSWSPFRRMNTQFPSIPTVLVKLLLKLVVFDGAHYIAQYTRPSIDLPAGDTIFDSALRPLPRYACAAFLTACGGLVICSTIDALYYMLTLLGRILLRQPAWRWPPLSDRPWVATSITEFWSFRWHQLFRHVFVVFGALPGEALLGRPGALMGAFAVSGVLHDLGTWGLGRGTEFRTVGGFFVLMGVGACAELGFRKMTGRRVGGLWGWAWTMVWTIGWGSMMIDAWARRGMIAADFFPYGRRPGKLLVDTIISLSR